jgi:hypothetical protein
MEFRTNAAGRAERLEFWIGGETKTGWRIP